MDSSLLSLVSPEDTGLTAHRHLHRRCLPILHHSRLPLFLDTLLTPSLSFHTYIEYAQVIKMLGNGRLEAMCFDGSKRLANIRGKLRKKVWINQGDIILLSLRDFQDDKGDVILKYSAEEARSLKSYGELPESAKINETDTFGAEGDGDCGFEFDEDRDSESDEAPNGGKEVDIDDI